jgi:lambda family phage tail tape measure protein
MEDAFMSIVDGSATAADAFRNMAREILAEAFKMLVVRPIMNSLFGGGGGGGILSALAGGGGVKAQEYGNAFHAGRVIPFANGGVVSGPTMFPMRGNQTGLMGEAGPEAIMPLKRGRDGKLGVQAEGGGGQSIVIHQSFNFQANGDESVKRIIAQEAPKIANLTQQQIIDQRKRGGVMKATF